MDHRRLDAERAHALAVVGAEWDGNLRSLKEWTDQRTLEDELVRLPPAAPERLRAVLDELNSRRAVPAAR